MCTYCALCIDAGMLAALVELEPLVTGCEQLRELRAMLREPGRFDLTPPQRLLRADLLDRICRRLVDEHSADTAYFEGCGDMRPAVPDDLSGLGP